MDNDIEDRLILLESRSSGMQKDFIDAMNTMSNNYLEAVKIQANSLSIPLLKDVLLPLMMKIFTFFSVLILLLLGGVLGIKMVFSDVLKGL